MKFILLFIYSYLKNGYLIFILWIVIYPLYSYIISNSLYPFGKYYIKFIKFIKFIHLFRYSSLIMGS